MTTPMQRRIYVIKAYIKPSRSHQNENSGVFLKLMAHQVGIAIQ